MVWSEGASRRQEDRFDGYLFYYRVLWSEARKVVMAEFSRKNILFKFVHFMFKNFKKYEAFGANTLRQF